MKAFEVIQQLQKELPQTTNLFSEEIALVSLGRSGTEAVAMTAEPHGFTDAQYVNIVGAFGKNLWASSSINGHVITVITSEPHDLTKGFDKTVTIEGADQLDANGEFELLEVPNSCTFTYFMKDNVPGSITGDVFLKQEFHLNNYNGRHQITVTSDTEFRYAISDLVLSITVGDIVVRHAHRISGALSPERALNAYTKQETSKLWAFVLLENSSTSKSRAIDSDAIDRVGHGSVYRQPLVTDMAILVFSPITTEISGRFTRDLMQDITVFLCKSILRFKPLKRFNEFVIDRVIYSGDSTESDENSFYVHRFSFEHIEDITILDTIPVESIDLNVIDLEFLKNDPFDDTIIMSVEDIILDEVEK